MRTLFHCSSLRVAPAYFGCLQYVKRGQIVPLAPGVSTFPMSLEKPTTNSMSGRPNLQGGWPADCLVKKSGACFGADTHITLGLAVGCACRARLLACARRESSASAG